jgi:hypothetical protein
MNRITRPRAAPTGSQRFLISLGRRLSTPHSKTCTNAAIMHRRPFLRLGSGRKPECARSRGSDSFALKGLAGMPRSSGCLDDVAYRCSDVGLEAGAIVRCHCSRTGATLGQGWVTPQSMVGIVNPGKISFSTSNLVSPRRSIQISPTISR